MRSARKVAIEILYCLAKADAANTAVQVVALSTFEYIAEHDDSQIGKTLRRNLSVMEEVIEADRRSTVAARAPS